MGETLDSDKTRLGQESVEEFDADLGSVGALRSRVEAYRLPAFMSAPRNTVGPCDRQFR